MTDFFLHINGWKYGAWTSQRITRSIEQLAHSFAVELTDKWQELGEKMPAVAGDAVAVSYKQDWVTNGYIDEDNADYDATTHNVSFSGRSLTGDLVDCAAVHKGGQWRNTGLLRIAKDLCDPFEISVSTATDLGGVFSHFELQDGETVFQALDRGCRRRGVLMLTKADGSLVFDRVGSAKVTTKLQRGVNILHGSRRNSGSDRFSLYTIKAQTQGNDNLFGEATTALKRSATDAGVTRYRPTIISAEDEESGQELQKRANWECNVRAGRAKRLGYTTPGWEHDKGLWEPNTLVTVEDPVFRVKDELLIIETTHKKNNNEGSVTELVLTFPEAFDVQPLPRPKPKKEAFF